MLNTPNHKQPLIIAENISKSVKTNEGMLTILDKINLNITAGESIAIVGESGSGKSTLLGLLAGLDVPTTGTVLIKGLDINKISENDKAELRSRWLAFVFQSFQLLPGLTALENVMLPLELAGDLGAKDSAKDYLQKVGLLQRINHTPKQLSGGEQQRVALARAFVTQPKILFADEPTGNLDSKTGKQIIDMLFQLNQQQQTTLILVTHDHNLANSCQRSIHLTAGNLV